MDLERRRIRVPASPKALIPYLITLSAVFGYGVFRYGAVLERDWNLCLFVLGGLALAYWLAGGPVRKSTPPDHRLGWFLVLCLAYAGFQVVPLPPLHIQR